MPSAAFFADENCVIQIKGTANSYDALLLGSEADDNSKDEENLAAIHHHHHHHTNYEEEEKGDAQGSKTITTH